MLNPIPIMRSFVFAAFALAAAKPVHSGESAPPRPRLIVTTDISSLTPGLREPDDGQSMVRLMLYANEIDIEGLIASSCMQHGQVVRPELIRQVVQAYGLARPSLVRHDRRYPSVQRLLACIKSGQPVAGTRTAVWDSIGPGRDTEASDWIIRVVDRPDPRPVWVAVWGGSADLAQALWKVRDTRSPEELEQFISKLRVHFIHFQDSTGKWIEQEFPSLWFINQGNSMRGMYRGGDTSLSSREWVEEHVKRDGGPLGANYPNYDGGDIWGGVKGVKEGDTPSYLGLISNGLNRPQEPELGGWGGRFKQSEPNSAHFVDAVDMISGAERDRAPGMATVYRWREAYQADFAARLQWCVKPYNEANHPPVVRVRGGLTKQANRDGAVDLDASSTSDPDGDRLTFAWTVYPESADCGRFENPASAKTRFHLAPWAKGVVHLLVTVRDKGLVRYGRLSIVGKGTIQNSK